MNPLTDAEYFTGRADALTCIALARGIKNGQEGGLAEFLRSHADLGYLAAAIALEAAYAIPVPNRELWQSIAALRELTAMADEDLGHG